ncbi:MAG: hypothetical protein FWE92_05720 [Defluviitaleaceae bacterium]|nr:hypothetical protein [Defluviitaleaceae bacterium]
MDNTENEVITTYQLTASLRETAKHCGISEQKVRKILLTNDIVPNSTITREIYGLYKAGMSVEDIAVKLEMSTKALNAHLPYKHGMYRPDNPSKNALRIRKHREGI